MHRFFIIHFDVGCVFSGFFWSFFCLGATWLIKYGYRAYTAKKYNTEVVANQTPLGKAGRNEKLLCRFSKGLHKTDP